jgi:hypothetical protein
MDSLNYCEKTKIHLVFNCISGDKISTFVSPMLEYVLQTELPRGWKIPKFTKFADDTSESTYNTLSD